MKLLQSASSPVCYMMSDIRKDRLAKPGGVRELQAEKAASSCFAAFARGPFASIGAGATLVLLTWPAVFWFASQ
jgi:hypothetical protein